MKLSRVQHDRSSAVLLGMACGDALGAGYAPTESPLGRTDTRFPSSPGEWTEYTALTVPAATAAADGLDLVAGPTPGLLPDGPIPSGAAGLFCTAPVALAYLHDPGALAQAARALSVGVHGDTDPGDAGVLWGLAIRHAVLDGELNLRAGLDALPEERRSGWAERISAAENPLEEKATGAGSAVTALQHAWSAIVHTDDSDASQYRRALEAAIRAAGDTSAAAGLAGALLAARWGLAAVPSEWRRMVRGRPALRGADLVRLSVLAAHGYDTNDAGERESFRIHAVT
jgi:ADP-ribosyl-[dinitrogen reductase] hydrolase